MLDDLRDLPSGELLDRHRDGLLPSYEELRAELRRRDAERHYAEGVALGTWALVACFGAAWAWDNFWLRTTLSLMCTGLLIAAITAFQRYWRSR